MLQARTLTILAMIALFPIGSFTILLDVFTTAVIALDYWGHHTPSLAVSIEPLPDFEI